MIDGLKKWQTGLPQVDEVLLLVREKFDELLRKVELLQGRITTTYSLGTTARSVPHGLGRVPVGRIIVGQSSDARIWDAKAPDKQYLTLQASASTTVRLWVF